MMNRGMLLLVGSVLARCATAATVTAIGVLNNGVNGAYSRAVAISPDGKVVVGDSRNASGIIDRRWKSAPDASVYRSEADGTTGPGLISSDCAVMIST